jgi:hypothetical protein
VTEQFSLIIDALKAKKNENPLLREFRDIVENDYKTFARMEDSLPNEADMFEKILQVDSDLEKILNFPVLNNKTVCAIGGGFSSGKSTFINTFFIGDTVRLAEDINPSTAIPSYVVCGDAPKITGYNTLGAPFDIGSEVYETINHETMKQLAFDFRSVIPYVTVSCPMDKTYFKNICLIDTPGYNAASFGAAEKDKGVAASAIENAHFLVWLVGLDQTGSIQKSDIDFLNNKTLYFGKKSTEQNESRDLYIVLNNKANCRTKDELVKILDSCEEVLTGSALDYAGMCAFDPCDTERSLYLCRKKDFFEFFAEKNKPNVNIDILYKAVRSVLDLYKMFLYGDINKIEKTQNTLKQLKNDVYYALKTGSTASLDKNFLELEKQFDSSKYKEHLSTLENLRKKFNACFLNISRSLGDTEWLPFPAFCYKCGHKLEKDWKGCIHCGTPVEI